MAIQKEKNTTSSARAKKSTQETNKKKTTKKTTQKTSIKKLDRRDTVIGILVLVIVVLVIVGMSTRKHRDTVSLHTDTQVAEWQTKYLIERASSNVLLPKNENPVVTVLSDVENLKTTQPFYINATDGQYLIVYQQNGIALIYDKQQDLVINMSQILVPQNTQTLPNDLQPASIEIRNAGVTEQVMSELETILSQSPLFDAITITRTQKPYQNITVVNMVGESASFQVDQIAQAFGAVIVDALPEGESNTTADIILIVTQQ